MDDLQPLLGTTLILMAHPDDEIIICGGLIQKMKKAVVVFATDGAPHDESFWKQYGSRQAYADLRRREANQALGTVGAQPLFLGDRLPSSIADQELFRNLPRAIDGVEALIAELHPGSILVPAYEGGHPDHDAACFIGSVAGRGRRVPVWESPLYHRTAEGGAAVQTFPVCTGSEIVLPVEGEALAKKAGMFKAYRSQNLVLEMFHPERETFRQIYDYDFTVPPLPWKLNYELWQWKMTGREVSAAFASYLQTSARVAGL